MQLHLKKNQSSKVFGGVKFVLEAQVTLTPEEANLISKYKVQDEVLAEKHIKIPLTDRALVIKLTIGSLTNGQTFKCNDVAEIIGYAEAIKGSCAELYERLETMKTFGGEEVIEFTSQGIKTISTHA